MVELSEELAQKASHGGTLSFHRSPPPPRPTILVRSQQLPLAEGGNKQPAPVRSFPHASPVCSGDQARPSPPPAPAGGSKICQREPLSFPCVPAVRSGDQVRASLPPAPAGGGKHSQGEALSFPRGSPDVWVTRSARHHLPHPPKAAKVCQRGALSFPSVSAVARVISPARHHLPHPPEAVKELPARSAVLSRGLSGVGCHAYVLTDVMGGL